MTTTVKHVVGTRTSLAYNSTDLSTLASATYVKNTTAYPALTNQPEDVIVEVDVTASTTTTGNKQVVVFLSESLDGTNYRSGPTSGTTTTDEPDLLLLGTVPLLSTNAQIRTFSIFQQLGYVPAKFFIIIKNDCGVALNAGTVWTAEVSTQF